MSQTIFKYVIDPEHPTLDLPPLIDGNGERRSLKEQILHADKQRGQLMVWAMVSPESPPRCVECQICVTGAPCDGIDPANHIATVLLFEGAYVFHLFMREAISDALPV